MSAATRLSDGHCPVPAHGRLVDDSCWNCGGKWSADGGDFATLAVRPTRGYQFMLSQIDTDPGRVAQTLADFRRGAR